MTNYWYCMTLYKEDLNVICRVFNRYVFTHHSGYLTYDIKEKLYYQWLAEEYDADEWQRARNIYKRPPVSRKSVPAF